MFLLEKSKIVNFDIDDCIVMWRWPEDGTVEQWIELDPWNDGTLVKLAVNTEMVEQIKQHFYRGHPVVIWSAGGWEWIKTVVHALKLEPYITVALEKPTWIYDDKEPEDFMPRAQWIGRKEWLK